jgi:NTE family protein
MKRIANIYIIILAISLVFAHSLYSQNSTEDTLKDKNPEIGLVLSGGAAKGIAHIGVLKVLEEAGIRPDYITGTSMGAIIGGLYSMGYSADELSELISRINWDKILTDRVPLNKIVMEEKNSYNRYMVQFPIRNYEFKLPSGLNEGYQLEQLFSNLTWRATGISQFDSLPIPFHCMAVDIIDGNLIEFDSGNLATALRASMGIPGIFAPIQKDSMLLVDGGVIRNFPVTEVKEMGADIVIGVYVGFKSEVTPEELFSLSDIISRTTLLSGVFDAKEQMELADILIKPNMEGLQAQDFMNSEKIEQRGITATRKYYEELKSLADSIKKDTLPKNKLTEPKQVYISEIDVENLRYVDKSFVIGKGRIFSKTSVTKKEINRAIDRIYGTRYFKKVNYELTQQKPGQYKLIYRVKENTRFITKGALHYDNHRGAGLILNGTMRNILIPNSRINIKGNISKNPGLRTTIYKYFGKKQDFMTNYFYNIDKTELPVNYQDEKVGSFNYRFMRTGLGTRYNYKENRQIGVDISYEKNSIFPGPAVKTIIPNANFNNYKLGGFALKMNYELNTLNRFYFPTKGTKINILFKRTFRPITSYSIDEDQSLDEEIFSLNLEPFNNFYMHGEHHMLISPDFSLSLGGTIGLTSGNSPITSYYALGGTMPEHNFKYEQFPGFSFGEKITPNFTKISGSIDFLITPRIFLTVSGNIGLTYDRANQVYSDILEANWKDYIKGYAGGLRFNSILGPLTFMVGDLNKDKKPKWYINLGYTF